MIKPDKLQHIAIIPDGNRRWAKKHGKPAIFGHTEGAKNIKRSVESALKLGIPYLTIWLFSTENLKRSKTEVAHFFVLAKKITDHIEELKENGIRLNLAGDLEALPKPVKKKFLEAVEATKKGKKLTLTLAAAYGGRDDIVRVIKKLINEKIPAKKITEKLIDNKIDLGNCPEIDLVVRTGGKYRLSGFFPWQTIYSELYFTDTYWPAFREKEFKKAVDWFYRQKRTRGR